MSTIVVRKRNSRCTKRLLATRVVAVDICGPSSQTRRRANRCTFGMKRIKNAVCNQSVQPIGRNRIYLVWNAK